MLLPKNRTIEKLHLYQGEIFIAAGGFEERALEVSRLLECDSRGYNAIVLEYSPDDSHNRAPELNGLLRGKGLSVTCVGYNRHAPEGFDVQLIKILKKLQVDGVCLDLSGMSRLAIMIIMDVVRELCLSLRVVYSEAVHYGPSEKEFEEAKAGEEQHLPTSFIHTGVYDVLHVERLSSIRMQSHATLLIAFDSFNEALCQVLVNNINPANFILINGRPPREELKWREKATEYVHHRLREEWSVGEDDRLIKATSTLHYEETYALLVQLYWKYSKSHRIILAPTGSKMQTVGCYLLRAIHNDVHVEYPTVQGFFADKYSTGVRELWEIDFGRLDELVNSLRKAELKDYLGLPEEIVNADVE